MTYIENPKGHVVFDCDGTLIMPNKQRQAMVLCPGIKELLLNLTQSGYQLYVWTARERGSTLRILKDLGVAHYFLEFRCVDDCEPKPSHRGLEEMIGDIDKEKAVHIGDSQADICGAQNFGIASIAACWADERLAEYLENFNPTSLAKRPMDCVKEIEKIIG